MLCIAHRGASGVAPENTLRAFETALRCGAPWIELDVHVVEDQLIVIHDDDLSRTTNGQGRLAERSFAYVRSLDAGDGERVPTLDEVFDLVDRRAGINIELKGPDTALPTLDRIQEALGHRGWTNEQFLVSSFDHTQLRIARGRLPAVRRGVLFPRTFPGNRIARARALGAYSVHFRLKSARRKLVDTAHAHGLQVMVYTVNRPADIRRMLAWGVDGVFSDFPERVLRLVPDSQSA